MTFEKLVEWLSGAAVGIVALLVLGGFARLAIASPEYLILIVAAMGGAGSYLYSRLH